MDAALPQDAIPTEKKVHGNKGRKPTEKQLEGLKKGMEALKARREAAKQQKATAKKDESSDDEAPPAAPAPKPKKLMSADKILDAIPLKPARTRRSPAKPAAPKGSLYASKDDFEAFKSQMFETLKTTPVIKEVPVEKIVDREVVREVPVHTEKVVTGSDLLNKIFNFN
jgi:hypothetical protein